MILSDIDNIYHGFSMTISKDSYSSIVYQKKYQAYNQFITKKFRNMRWVCRHGNPQKWGTVIFFVISVFWVESIDTKPQQYKLAEGALKGYLE